MVSLVHRSRTAANSTANSLDWLLPEVVHKFAIVFTLFALDVDFIKPNRYDSTKISDVMVPFDKLIIGNESMTLDQAYEILEEEKRGKSEPKTRLHF
jgi:hypothetical protein